MGARTDDRYRDRPAGSRAAGPRRPHRVGDRVAAGMLAAGGGDAARRDRSVAGRGGAGGRRRLRHVVVHRPVLRGGQGGGRPGRDRRVRGVRDAGRPPVRPADRALALRNDHGSAAAARLGRLRAADRRDHRRCGHADRRVGRRRDRARLRRRGVGRADQVRHDRAGAAARAPGRRHRAGRRADVAGRRAPARRAGPCAAGRGGDRARRWPGPGPAAQPDQVRDPGRGRSGRAGRPGRTGGSGAMILVVALNPALDITHHVAGADWAGANRPFATHARAGGKGLNVARTLRALGQPVTLTGLAGGLTGRALLDGLDGTGIVAELTPIAGETRRTFAVADSVTGQTALFNEPGPAVSAPEYQQFFVTYENSLAPAAAVVLSGSLPPGVPPDSYAGLIAAAAVAGVPAILDASGDILASGAAAGPALVKPNLAELETAAGHGLRTAGR